jgi:2-methylcitrate dehydratase PrpD
MTKSFHPGKAAADGLLSVLLAQRGYTSAGDILEDGKGLGNILSSDFNSQRGLRDLGAAYTLRGTSIKPFASCLYTHPTIDAVIRLRNDHGITPEAVDGIRCGISKFCKDAANQKHPQTGLAAKFSVTFCAALALLEGKAGESLFQDAATRNPQLLDMMCRVEVEEIPGLKDSEARVTITLRNGQRLEQHVQHPLGSPAHPLSDDQVEEKARDLLAIAFDREKAGIIIDKLWLLEKVESISEITSLLTMGE